MVIAILQRIFYDEWLPRVVDVPAYKGYNSTIQPDIKQAFVTLHSDLIIRWFATSLKEQIVIFLHQKRA